MRGPRAAFSVLIASVLVLLAGCPQVADPVTGPAPWSGRTGDTGNTGGGGAAASVGPQVPAADTGTITSTGGTTNTTGTESSPVVVGGDTTGTTTASDALTVRFPECQEPAEADFWRSEIMRLVNQERQSQGLDPVTWNQALEDQATEYACELIHYDYFGHVNAVTGSTLTDRAAQFGYEYWIIGENLAAGQRSPVQAVSDWINSPCHRENILNPAFTELGVGIRVGGDYGFYWVQEFGRPLDGPPYGGPHYSDPACVRE